eukprot:2630132-Amphidinium_carterae.1
MRAVLLWADEQDVDVNERDIYNRFGPAVDAAEQVDDILKKSGQLYVALQQLTSKVAFDVCPWGLVWKDGGKTNIVEWFRRSMEKWD